MTSWVLVAQLAASAAMAAIAWFVQVVHYPLFASLSGDSALERRYHQANVRRTQPVVLVPMFVEGLAAAWLVAFPPAAVGRPLALAGLALVAVTLLSTLVLQVPLHERLCREGSAPATVAALVRGTTIRTVAWTARMLLSAWMLHAALGGA
ncbi:MAG: hypothetical protein ACKO3G_09250 [Planctomycetaceae bacterium]